MATGSAMLQLRSAVAAQQKLYAVAAQPVRGVRASQKPDITGKHTARLNRVAQAEPSSTVCWVDT